MASIKKFEYKEHLISFEFEDGNKMINAAEMAKPFDKRVNDFLRLKSTKEYILLLEARYGNPRNGGNTEVLRVVQGGTPELQGTWMNEKLALKFAAWLAPLFELWVYDRIYELLTTGKTELETRPTQNIIKSIRLIADHLETHDKDIETLKEDVIYIKEYVGDLEAKITSIDENYYSVSGYCSLHSIECHRDKAIRLGKLCTAKSHSMGYEIGKAYDSKFGTVNTYHIDILKKVIK